LGAFGPENGHDLRRRKNGRRVAAPRPRSPADWLSI
jgi:hypothetical protein